MRRHPPRSTHQCPRADYRYEGGVLLSTGRKDHVRAAFNDNRIIVNPLVVLPRHPERSTAATAASTRTTTSTAACATASAAVGGTHCDRYAVHVWGLQRERDGARGAHRYPRHQHVLIRRHDRGAADIAAPRELAPDSGVDPGREELLRRLKLNLRRRRRVGWRRLWFAGAIATGLVRVKQRPATVAVRFQDLVQDVVELVPEACETMTASHIIQRASA